MNSSKNISTSARPSAANHVFSLGDQGKAPDQDIKVEDGFLKVSVPFIGTIKNLNATESSPLGIEPYAPRKASAESVIGG